MSLSMRVPKRELASYFGYAVGQCFSFGLVGTFIIYFYTDILGISALVASTIFVIARVWDAFNDPIIAGYMDTLNLKKGKFRPYMLYMPFIICVITIASFYNIEASMSVKIAYAAITYILWGTLYTISDVPFWSLSSVMSDQPQERAKVITCAMLGVNVGIGLATFSFPKIAAYFAPGTADQGYLTAVVILMIIGFFLMINSYFHVKERVSVNPNEKVTLKDTFKVLKINKPLFTILAVFFLNIFTNVAAGLNIYFFQYNLGDSSLISYIGIIGIIAALCCFITPILTRRYRKKDIFIVLCVLEIIFRVLFFITGYENLNIVFSFILIITMFNMMTNPLVSAMLVDTVEYSYYKTGKRCAAITFSGQTFTGKLAVALAGGATGLILTLIHYAPNVQQQPETLSWLFFCISLLPAVGAVLRLFLLIPYKFTEEEHAILLEKIKRGEFGEEAGIQPTA